MGKFLRWLIFYILPLVVMIGGAVLENLSSSKMGVNRYLLFKKTHYAETAFTPERIKLYIVLLVAGILVSLFLFIRKGQKVYAGSLIVYQGTGIVLLSLKNLSAYPFFAFGIIIAIFLQYCWLILFMFKRHV